MSSDDVLATVLSELYYAQYKVAVYSNLCKGIVFGFYIIVYVASVYVLLSKPGFTSSPGRKFQFGITTVMFALGIIALVLETTTGFMQAKSMVYSSILDTTPQVTPQSFISYTTFQYFIWYNLWAAITCLMYILCDTICAWRTMVLWNNDKCIIGILAFFILGTAGTAGYAIARDLIDGASPGDHDLTLGELDLILVGPTPFTNLLSTGLIAWKAWQHRIPVREHLYEGKGTLKFGRVFALLIESGLVYCCIWILYWISKSTKFPDPGFTVMAFVSGLYPTLIIILVSKQWSPVEHYSAHLTEIQFTPVPGLEQPTDDGAESRHRVLTIRHDSTSD